MSEKIKISRIIRSKRKTIAMEILPDARIIVRAPRFVPGYIIKRMVDKNKKWISKKLKDINQIQKSIQQKKYLPGEEFLFLGEKYSLCF